MADIVVNGNTSGAVTLSAPAVAGTVTVTLPAASGTMLTTSSSTGISGSAISSGTVPEAYGGTGTSTGYYGFKNRIINGAMTIDQRNAGASVATATVGNFAYSLDRFSYLVSQASKFTIQQTPSTTETGFAVRVAAGFINYLACTVGASANVTIGSNDFFNISQPIEGFNFADMAWGTANASTVTLSFWIRSSLTGTFGGALRNSAANRSYPFAYTISSANTWEQKTVTIAGDTSGTWIGATNGVGVTILFGLGVGTTYSGTAGAWAGANYLSSTGATSVVGTNGATFYITGVQLEKGSTATSFDYRPYGTELALCQRYYFKNIPAVAGSNVVTGVFNGTTNLVITAIFPVPMRVAPTMTQLSMSVADGVTPNAVTSIGTQAFGVNSGLAVMNGTSASYATGRAGYLFTQSTSSFVDFTAEL